MDYLYFDEVSCFKPSSEDLIHASVKELEVRGKFFEDSALIDIPIKWSSLDRIKLTDTS